MLSTPLRLANDINSQKERLFVTDCTVKRFVKIRKLELVKIMEMRLNRPRKYAEL